VTNTDARLRQLATASHVLSRTLRRTGEIQVGLEPLPQSEYDLLEFVGSHPGASVSDVARGLRLQTSNVSNTVRQLVRRGLVERTADPRDQRRVLLRLTAMADRHGEMLKATWASVLAGLLPGISERDAELLLAAAPALARLADLAATGPTPPGSTRAPVAPAASGT
jgi:DNA-binding MarR family transcriptional regulator